MDLLACPIHVKGTSFRKVPNTSVQRLHPSLCNFAYLLAAFKSQLELRFLFTNHCSRRISVINPRPLFQRTSQVDDMLRRIDLISEEYDAEPRGCSYKLLDTLHNAIDAVDIYLTTAVDRLDVITTVRRYIEVLLHLHNDKRGDKNLSDRLAAMQLIEREPYFMDTLFRCVRPAVIGDAEGHGEEAEDLLSLDSGTREEVAARDVIGDPINNGSRLPARRNTDDMVLGVRDKANNIWRLLVFCTICWLMLHDVDSQDVMAPRSWLLGSTLKMYIR
jgi:hypothetical protein